MSEHDQATDVVALTAVRVWWSLAVLGFGFLVAQLGLHFGAAELDHIADRWDYDGLELWAAIGCLTRAAFVREERIAWGSLGLGLLSFAIGDVCFDFVYNGSPPTPSVADVFYLAFYPCCCLTIVLLVKRRIGSFDRTLWLDGIIAGFAVAALSASVVLQAVIRQTHGSLAHVATDLAYPIADLVLLGLVVFVFAINNFRLGRTWALVGSAFALLCVADSVFLYLSVTRSYEEGTIVDALWPAAMLLLAASAWQRVEVDDSVTTEGRVFTLTPLLCGVVALAVLVENRFQPHNFVADSLAATSILTALVRMTLSFLDNTRLLDQARALSLTDELTSLGNRRRLLLDLDRRLGPRGPSPTLLAIIDLNGFKRYNDSFGHPAGDALLQRLGRGLAHAVAPNGHAYRLGGDEFCILVPLHADGGARTLEAALDAVNSAEEGTSVACEHGTALIPEDACDASSALRIADERLYARKNARYRSADATAEPVSPNFAASAVVQTPDFP